MNRYRGVPSAVAAIVTIITRGLPWQATALCGRGSVYKSGAIREAFPSHHRNEWSFSLPSGYRAPWLEVMVLVFSKELHSLNLHLNYNGAIGIVHH